jgi:hypothetical protein
LPHLRVLIRRQQLGKCGDYFRLTWDSSPFGFPFDDQPEDIASLQSAIDQIACDRKPSFARQVEGLFHVVGEPG